METLNFREIELKYKADNIQLLKFKALVESFKPNRLLEVSSYDIYYTNNNNEFIRFRKNGINSELTIKRKTEEKNNINRTELNIPIKTDNESLIGTFAELLGYRKNFKIFKSCWIYYFDKVDVVYYITYDEEMKELSRFIEIEVMENLALTEEESYSTLKEYELKLAPLGLQSVNRLKKSLFEQYKK